MKLGKTIRHQIIILTILVLITSLLGSLFIAHRAFSETFTKNTFSKLANDVTYVSQKVLQKTDALNETLLLDYAQNTLIRITLMDEKGDVIFDSDYKTERMDNHFYREELEKARKDGFGTAKRYSATEDVDVLYYARFLGSDSAIPYVRVSSQLSQLKQYNAIYRNLFFSGLLFLLIATLIITLLSIRAITHPLEELHAVVEEYIQGNLFARSAVESPKELALLSSTLNHMAEQLQTTIEEIESQKQLYSSILHSMSEGIVSLDRKNIIMEANKAATELLIGKSSSKHNLIGNTLIQLTNSSMLLDACSRALTEKKVQEIELPKFGQMFGESASIVGKRQTRILRISIHPVQEESAALSLVLTINDITDLKRLESMRKEFVANVSHELKSPITAIYGFSSSLLEGAMEDPQSQSKFISIIHRQALHMQRIVEDLLLLSSLEQHNAKPTKTWTTVHQIVSETLEACQYKISEKESQVTVSITNQDQRELYVNGRLIVQALSNLIINALTYSDPHSTIFLRIFVDQNRVSFTVEDHGYGIPSDALERIFERFYRVDAARSRSQGGTGLGLSIVKHICQVHDGTVSVHSIEGKGSSFTIELPREGKELDQLQQKSVQLFDTNKKHRSS